MGIFYICARSSKTQLSDNLGAIYTQSHIDKIATKVAACV